MIGRWNDEGDWVPLKPSPSDYIDNVEPHDRGAVLVATIFDAFQRIYNFRTRDLLRIATNGTGVLPEGSISRDLVHRLAGEAARSPSTCCTSASGRSTTVRPTTSPSAATCER